ncbi:diacylglycerol kinase [Nocardioides marmoriginsengisoli]|uniref:Diacylglycerol kinase n=1 Tax=Nocardioides marmoriginsengisoli TaxID=661483 RepID=A0A3N0CBZ9_9ACTN|nr:diacylglycerol kinase [Nocardioides marmoriginsengisoli]
MITHADAGHADDLGTALEVLRTRASVEVCETSNPGELDGILHRAGSRPIVVAGGDGSLHAVVATLHRRNDLGGKTLGLLPLGTGNDFARALDIPLDPAEAAEALLSATPRPMDILVDELGEVVVNNVHAGASARASRTGATWKERLGPFGLGVVGYPIGAVLTAIRPPYVRLRIEVDGEVVADMDRHVLMVAIGNGSSVGGGAEITPGADPGSGMLDVMISYAADPLARVGYALDVLRRTHPERDDVVTLTGKQVSISGEDFWISADGEISGPERRRTWHVEPAAYTMLAPTQTRTQPSSAS